MLFTSPRAQTGCGALAQACCTETLRAFVSSPTIYHRNKLRLRSSRACLRTLRQSHSIILCVALLLVYRTMPIFSYFYSATEEEAATRLRQHFPQPSEEAVSFSNRNAEQLELLLNGTTVSKPRPRNEFNQPLFHPKRAKPIGQLFNACTFGVTHKNVYRDKLVPFGSTSDDPQEWQTRSRTPSSDEPSPQKYCLPSPTPSVKVEASSNSDCSEDGLTHMYTRPNQDVPRHHADPLQV